MAAGIAPGIVPGIVRASSGHRRFPRGGGGAWRGGHLARQWPV